MSLLFVSYDSDKKDFVTVEITRIVAKYLLETVTVPLAKKVDNSDFLDEAEAELMMKNFSLYRFNDEQFQEAYELIKKNRDNPILEPYVDELLAKMEEDLRLEHEHA